MDVATKFGENLAVEVVKAANKNKEQLEYDRTFFCTILKTSTDISDSVTEAEAATLDNLNSGWYYVKIYGTFYKLRCDSITFNINEDVKVCVPQNNWNRMYIEPSANKYGSGEVQKIDFDEDFNRLTVYTTKGKEIYNLTVEGDWVTAVEKDGAIVVTQAETKELSNLQAAKAISSFVGKIPTGLEFDFYCHYPNDTQDFRNFFSSGGVTYGSTYTIDWGDGTGIQTGGLSVLTGHVYGEIGYFRVKIQTDATDVILQQIPNQNLQTKVSPMEIWIGTPITTIHSTANNTYYARLIMGDSVTDIDNYIAFFGDDYRKLTGKYAMIRLSKNLHTVSQALAFNHCAIRGICIPASLTTVGIDLFAYCTLQNVTIEGGDNQLNLNGKFLYNAGRIKKITVPSRVVLTRQCFAECYVNMINIRYGVEIIPSCAFEECSKDEKAYRYRPILHINIPTSVTSIGDHAFYDNAPVEIHYAGSSNEWAQIDKDDDWDYNVNGLNVYYEDTYEADGVDGV